MSVKLVENMYYIPFTFHYSTNQIKNELEITGQSTIYIPL